MLQKQAINIPFKLGLDLKTDPFQLPLGTFLNLENSVFTVGGQLTKRNGFGALSPLPVNISAGDLFTYVTTYQENLLAVGNTLQAYIQANNTWVNQGEFRHLSLDTLPVVRTSTNQSQADSAVAPNGLVCTVYTDNIPNSETTSLPVYKYVVAVSTTGQNVIQPTIIVSAGGVVTGSPKVYVIGHWFIIIFSTLFGATWHLQYIPIDINTPSVAGGAADISTVYTPSTTTNFCAFQTTFLTVSKLFIAWNGSDGSVRATYLTSNLGLALNVIYPGFTATLLSITTDTTDAFWAMADYSVYVTFYNSATSLGFTLVMDSELGSVLAPTATITGQVVVNLTMAAQNGLAHIIYEVFNVYGYTSPPEPTALQTDYIAHVIMTRTGVVTAQPNIIRSLGLASEAFIAGTDFRIYFLCVYSSVDEFGNDDYQPGYYLIDIDGHLIAKLAYENAGGYFLTGLPSITTTTIYGNIGTTVSPHLVNGVEIIAKEDVNFAQIAYLYKDLVINVNKTMGIMNSGGIYSQLGVNLVTFDFDQTQIITAIANDLLLTGGVLWMYDGSTIFENGFMVWPDNVQVTTSGAGGAILAGTYFYVATYEWQDANGNLSRSAPSLPSPVPPLAPTAVYPVTGGIITTGTASSNTIFVPTLRISERQQNPALPDYNPVQIVIYRTTLANPTVFKQITSVQFPILNNSTIDFITYIDVFSDAQIQGGNLLYTTGGIVENDPPPSTNALTLFDTRVWLIDNEDGNKLWFSKQVSENSSVDFSEYLTLYISPTISAQNDTGECKVLCAMDDKLLIFKENSLYYVSGTGPDNSAVNSQFSEPTFITSTVGSTNPHSIVFMPLGIMFQTDKGIWLLSRDLSTNYIGAPVERLTKGALVTSSVNIPDTNQVRFTLDSGIILMYDYYYRQWGTFTNIPNVSSTLYQNLHTIIDSFGRVAQETPGIYLDFSAPVLLSFTSSWYSLSGVQGYERFYEMLMLGNLISPFTLNVCISYNYNVNASQAVTVTPQAFSQPYGGDPLYGDAYVSGGHNSIFKARVFPNQQKVESFRLEVKEQYDGSFGVEAGAGLTLSGFNLVVGLKKGYRPEKASESFG